MNGTARKINRDIFMKFLMKFVLLAVCIFVGMNWFVRPMFPMVAESSPHLTLWTAMGVSGVIMACLLILKG